MIPLVPLLACVAAVALTYAVAASLLASRILGLLAAAIFALTSLVWQQASVAPATVYPFPLVLGWLLCMSLFVSSRQWWWAAAAGMCLGAGVYISPAAAVMMPVYVAVTLAVLVPSRDFSFRDVAVFAGAFAIVSIPQLFYWLTNSDDFRAIVKAHHLYDADRFTVLQGIREITSWVGMTARSEVYWDYLNPAFLFVTGRVLPWPLVVLLPVGVYYVLLGQASLLLTLTTVALAASPFAASLTAEAPAPGRITWIIPFAVIIAVFGVRQLMQLRVPKAPGVP